MPSKLKTREPDPSNPRHFEEVPEFGEFVRKVGRSRVRMLKDGPDTARLLEDVPALMAGEAAPVFNIHPLELMLD